VCGALGYGLLNIFVPPVAAGIILCVLPLLSLTGMFMVMHGRMAFIGSQRFVIDSDGVKRPAHGIREVPTFRRLRVSRCQMLIRLGLPSALWGLGFGPVIFEVSGFGEAGAAEPWQLLINIAVACAMALLLVGLMTVINRDQIYGRYYRFVMPVIPLAVLAAALLYGSQAFCIFLFATGILFAFLVWVELTELSHQYRISPILVFGFSLTFFVAAASIGRSVMTLAVFANSELAARVWLLVGCAIMLLVVAGFFLMPNEDDIRKVAVVEGSAVLGNGESFCIDDEQEGQAGEEKSVRRRFTVRCEEVANTYLLTARETDVLYLLAKGHSAAHLAKQLYISLGTVHTHTWHIYRKLGVHTQQELIDLVDNQGCLECPHLTTAEEDDSSPKEEDSSFCHPSHAAHPVQYTQKASL
jgi:DNA-binding CsgD family transcriptional regulator